MDQTLRQLGELLLGAVPTVIVLVALYILYTFLVHHPLTAVLAERRNSEYEQRLRDARQKIFKNQEARHQQASHSRTQAANEARSRAQQQVKEAREAIEQDKQQAMSRLQSDAASLATDIVRTVLRPVASPSQVGGQ
jgi:F-type H+-transporting ATPase subunit b